MTVPSNIKCHSKELIWKQKNGIPESLPTTNDLRKNDQD